MLDKGETARFTERVKDAADAHRKKCLDLMKQFEAQEITLVEYQDKHAAELMRYRKEAYEMKQARNHEVATRNMPIRLTNDEDEIYDA